MSTAQENDLAIVSLAEILSVDCVHAGPSCSLYPTPVIWTETIDVQKRNQTIFPFHTQLGRNQISGPGYDSC